MNELQTLSEAGGDLALDGGGGGNGHQAVTLSGLGAITKAEIDVQISTAKAYPRSIKLFQLAARQMVELDQETAASCYYVLPRAGKKLTGPSIRLAEIAASAWGNLRYGARVIGDDGRMLTAQGVCHDLERNVFSSQEVLRRATGRNGQRFSDDMVVVTANAACSIALRNAIFRVIPRAYINPLVQMAMKVAGGDVKTLTQRRASMLGYFKTQGIEEARVFAAVGKPGLEDIGLEEMALLHGAATALKDGLTTAEEAFPPLRVLGELPPANRTERLGERLQGGPSPPRAADESGLPLNPGGRPPQEEASAAEPTPHTEPAGPAAATDQAGAGLSEAVASVTDAQKLELSQRIASLGLSTTEVQTLLREKGVRALKSLSERSAADLLGTLGVTAAARGPGLESAE